MDALGLQAARGRRFQEALDECGDAEKYTLGLRLRWFPWLEIGFFLPIATSVLWGGWLAWNGHISIAAATAVDALRAAAARPARRADLLARRDPVRARRRWRASSGSSEVPPDRVATGERPDGEQVDVDDVRYSYRRGPRRAARRLARAGAGRAPGHRRAVGRGQVDPRAASWPASTARAPGGSTGGGVPLVDLELPVLRGEVALVTQEHHVFVGTLADNLRLPRPEASDAELREALSAVDALELGATRCPRGSTRSSAPVATR